MIRAIIISAMLLMAMGTQAQSVLSHPRQTTDTNYLRPKWFVTKYAGISTGFVAFKGGSSSFVSAPLELMINRQLTNNIFAFGGVSATPYLLRHNNAFYQGEIDKRYGSMRTSNFGINPAARVGVMYISNDRTFSVSGSISVSRSTYPSYYSPVYGPADFRTW